MYKTRLYHTLILCLLPALLWASPRLTVVAIVDGMSEQDLALLRPYWGKGGMRTLSEEAYQTTINFPHTVYGGNETTATLMTGTTPMEHGYSMDYYYSRRDRKPRLLLEDEQAQGIGSARQLSPRNLLSPTITDALRMQWGAQAKIYAIGIHAETAILLAGHAANACCWIESAADNTTDSPHWASSSYYSGGLPSAADRQNIEGRVAAVASRLWTPRMDIPMYAKPTESERKKPFSYMVKDILCQSPSANTLVIELALAMQETEKLGADQVPDLLMLELTTATPLSTADRIESAEREDIYLWLNQDIGYLMEQLDRRIGHDKYEIMLVGRPALGQSKEAMANANIPVQTFNVDRAAALIGTYLMAIYGHERWVDGGYGNAIYLNRTLIEQKRLSLETIQRQVANFLMDFEGVQLAFPQHEALLHPLFQASLNKRFAGDVCFSLQPGWQLMSNENTSSDNVLDTQAKAPLLLWSGSLRPMPGGILSATDVKNLIVP